MNTLNNQEIVTYDRNNQEVVVRTKRKKIMGPFSAIGKMSHINNVERDDIFDRLNQVSKGAFGLFTEFKSRRSEDNNLITFYTETMSKTHKETMSRHLRELRKHGVVKRALRNMVTSDPARPYVTKKNTYMINPELLKCWDFDEARLLWEQCK